jgi:hypothetical protein
MKRFACVLVSAAAVCLLAMPALAGPPVTMPAYYDGQFFTINFTELPPAAEQAQIAHNQSINTIYQSDSCMPGGQMFVSVLDAIQGDGFNPLWREVQITFNEGFPCQQFTSDNDIVAAAAAGQITLTPTDEVYVCAVIGPRPH